MMHALIAAATAAAVFRIVPLACSGDRLVVAGGGVLRLAAGTSCAAVVPGRPLGIMLGDDNRALPQPLTPDSLPAAKIPHEAYLLAPAAERDPDQTAVVPVEIDVTVPSRTPSSDDIYISTERSNWSPSELRMDRIEARHFRLTLQIHRGARIAFRVTRGSYTTLERDASRALPPAHIASDVPGLHVTVDVAAWADID